MPFKAVSNACHSIRPPTSLNIKIKVLNVICKPQINPSRFWGHVLQDLALLAPLKGFEDLGPELVSFADVVCQANVRHACLGATGHGLELGDHILETEGFAYGLGGAGFEKGVDDVDVEVVIRGLIYEAVSMG